MARPFEIRKKQGNSETSVKILLSYPIVIEDYMYFFLIMYPFIPSCIAKQLLWKISCTAHTRGTCLNTLH